VAARSALSREFVSFFERDVPLALQAVYSLTGALLLLLWYDVPLVFACLALLLPAWLLNQRYGRKTLWLSGRLHDQLEREVEVIERGRSAEVRNHYDLLAGFRVRLSDAEAINFSLMELFVLALMAAALLRSCMQPGATAGDIFAVFRYVLMFVTGLDAVPMLVQQVSRLRDIGRRMSPENNEGVAQPV
jgi:ABC-type multidrug transport system fused ATPase/permease subunit